MIVKVLINSSVKNLNKAYDYLVPEDLKEKIEIGKRVLVSFGYGANREEEGIIVRVDNTEQKIEENSNVKIIRLKNILGILDDYSYIDENKLKLAKWMSYIYFCNVYDSLKLMLPPGTNNLNNKKILNSKQEDRVVLKKSKDEITELIDGNIIKSGKQIRVLKLLIENDFVLKNDIVENLNISRAILKAMELNEYIGFEKVDIEEDNFEYLKIEKSYPLEPTEEQKVALKKTFEYIDSEKYEQCLLFGVTGSGKTEVYLQSIERVISKGKTAIVLVPEISLTHQTVSRFVARFGHRIAILHSRMTLSKRKEEYKKIYEGKVDIVIGARSAIFAPLKNLGLVIIDEEHDSSYYSQTTPKYSTKEVAAYICSQNNAVLLLGSATPDITSFYKAKEGHIGLIEMKNRPGNAVLPEIIFSNTKEDRLLGNKSVISLKLKEEILKNIKSHEQTMIFLNRRGYSSYLKCEDCDYIFKCKNCDVSLTYHKNNDMLLCHYCSHVEKNNHKCPKCSSENISQGTVGTQKIEEELKSIYNEISILRMDADSTLTRDAHQKILDTFKSEKIDVLIGTQMIAKGHDIDNVTLVGILGADAMISMNDFLAQEKAYSNISQVSGRAGRKDKKGRVIIQTSDEENYIFQAIKNHDYESFYEKEIDFRNKFEYPPFIDILLFEMSSKDLQRLKIESQKLYEILKKSESIGKYKVFTPQSPYIQKVSNRYRVSILIKCKISSQILKNIYENLSIYDKIRNKEVRLNVTKNPNFI